MARLRRSIHPPGTIDFAYVPLPLDFYPCLDPTFSVPKLRFSGYFPPKQVPDSHPISKTGGEMKNSDSETIRVSTDLGKPTYERLVKVAKAEDRSIASLVRHLIRNQVERQDGAAA
jgi:hypothetical protein